MSQPAEVSPLLEAYTLQLLPEHLRPAVIWQIGEFVATDGTLFVIARGRDERDDPGTMPSLAADSI